MVVKNNGVKNNLISVSISRNHSLDVFRIPVPPERRLCPSARPCLPLVLIVLAPVVVPDTYFKAYADTQTWSAGGVEI